MVKHVPWMKDLEKCVFSTTASFFNLESSTSKVLLWIDNKATIHKVNWTHKVDAK
jgi:hypothetical protein